MIINNIDNTNVLNREDDKNASKIMIKQIERKIYSYKQQDIDKKILNDEKVTIYEDYKKIIVKEVRSYFKHRRDKLILRRRFPYKFITIEHYESSEK